MDGGNRQIDRERDLNFTVNLIKVIEDDEEVLHRGLALLVCLAYLCMHAYRKRICILT